MFQGLKGMAGLAGMMKDLPRIKARMEEVKGELAAIYVTASAGGGGVTVTASADLRITEVSLDPGVIAAVAAEASARPQIEAMIQEACTAALDLAKAAAHEHLASAAQELGVPMPDGDLGGLLS